MTTTLAIPSTTSPVTLPGCTRLSDLIPQPITWLWPNRIPFDAPTLLDAEPGLGSSLFALTLAAHVSSGSPLPDGTPVSQSTVILVAPNDSPTRVLLPRLKAANADLSRIILLTSAPQNLPASNSASVPTPDTLTGDHPFSLPNDFAHLEAVITAEHAALVILDPLSTLVSAPSRPHLPESHPTSQPSTLFTALTHLAERTHCAILLVRHLSQGKSTPLTRYGSCPIHLHLLPDPNHEDQRLLCTTKNTLSQPAPHLTYRLTASSAGAPLLTCLGTNRFLHSVIQSSAHSSLSANRQAVIHVLIQASRPLTLSEITQQTSLPADTIRLLVSRMAQSAEIVRPYRGAYTTPTHPCLDTPHSPWPIVFSPDLLQFLHSPSCTFDSLLHSFPEVQQLSIQGILDLMKDPPPLPSSPDPDQLPFQPFPPATTDTTDTNTPGQSLTRHFRG